jgi:hypothetical protein
MANTCPDGYLTLGEAYQQGLSILENADQVARHIDENSSDEERCDALDRYEVLERRVEQRLRTALARRELPVFVRTQQGIERLVETQEWQQLAIAPCLDDVPEPVTNPGPDTNGQLPLLKASDFHEWLTSEKHRINPFRTGAPGKPSGIGVVEREHRRRMDAGEAFESVRQEASHLKDWLDRTYPEAPATTAKTIENRIRAAHRQRTVCQSPIPDS